ncbi:hypothetical protein N7G274_007076 [Stereocaulon virgatum]|uniref:Uncharacterized protein n=1 Tax=Stereocaulon virgatum TaxID=373712 RepID=A0ABR4A529_9LECA
MANNRQADQGSNSGGLGGIGDKLSDAVGGSAAGGVQDYVSKGIETLQQTVFGQGESSKPEAAGRAQQSHEVAVDQAHPEKVSEFLRDKHMSNAK